MISPIGGGGGQDLGSIDFKLSGGTTESPSLFFGNSWWERFYAGWSETPVVSPGH